MITYSGEVQLYRSTQFDRNIFRTFGITSGSNVNEEFSTSIDLREAPFPTYPIAVVSPNITLIKFAVINVTGGEATIRLVNEGTSYNSIDTVLRGSMILSGVTLTQILVINHLTPCFIECVGAGIRE